MTDAAVTSVRVDQISGVRTVWSPVAGPVRAALSFRVGWADEDLPHHGITHLVEHLTLSRLGQRPYEFNGMVEETRTTFHCAGSLADVVEFLDTVTSALADLPLDRLEQEKRILRVEHDGQTAGAVERLRIWRFGAQAHGLAGYDEYALRCAAPTDVAAWAARWFTAGNATLALTSEPPADLSLRLPDGPARPARPASAITDVPLPARVTGADGSLVVSMLGDRGLTFGAYEWVLQRRLFERLRLQEAVSYSVQTARRALDADRNELFVRVDALPDTLAQVETGLLDVLDDLAAHGPSSDEVEQWRAVALRPLDDPATDAALVFQAMIEALYDRPVRQRDDAVEQILAVTPEAIAEIAASAPRSALYLVPGGSTVVAERVPAAPAFSAAAVDGRRFRAVAGDNRSTVVVGDAGLSLVADTARRITVPWSACVAVLRWDDGGRTVFGADGFVVDLAPQEWRDFAPLRDEIDRRAPASAAVPMGESPKRAPAPLPRSRIFGGESTTALALFVVLLTPLVVMMAFTTVGVFAAVGLPMLALDAVCGREIYLRARKRRATPGKAAPVQRQPTPRAVWIVLVIAATLAVAAVLAHASTAVFPVAIVTRFVIAGLRRR